jgi:hypothetical protein
MRTLRAVIFVLAGILLGLLFLDEFVFHIANGETIQYVFMVLFLIGCIACLRVALADWRSAREPRDANARHARTH